MKQIPIPNVELFSEVRRLMAEGREVTILARGSSMLPFIRDGVDKVLLAPAYGSGEKADGSGQADEPNTADPGGSSAFSPGDILLCEVAPGRFVLHRLIGFDGGRLILMGDGNLVGRETCTRSQVRGRATAFYRKGSERPVSTDGRLWKTYSALWTHLLPVRRYLLAFYRLVWLKIHPSSLNRHTHETQKRI